MRDAAQRRADGQCHVFRRGWRAKHAQLTHGVVATPPVLDQTGSRHALEEVRGGRLRLPETLFRFLEGASRTAFRNQLVCKRQALMW